MKYQTKLFSDRDFTFNKLTQRKNAVFKVIIIFVIVFINVYKTIIKGFDIGPLLNNF